MKQLRTIASLSLLLSTYGHAMEMDYNQPFTQTASIKHKHGTAYISREIDYPKTTYTLLKGTNGAKITASYHEEKKTYQAEKTIELKVKNGFYLETIEMKNGKRFFEYLQNLYKNATPQPPTARL